MTTITIKRISSLSLAVILGFCAMFPLQIWAADLPENSPQEVIEYELYIPEEHDGEWAEEVEEGYLAPRAQSAAVVEPFNIPVGSILYFGEYPQSKYANKYPGDTPPSGRYLVGDDNSGGLQIPAYYTYDPIAWRVLDNRGVDGSGGIVLISDKTLEFKRYHENSAEQSAYWAGSDIRTWLNSSDRYVEQNPTGDNAYRYVPKSFKGEAFTSDELKVLKETTVSVSNNPSNGTPGGSATNDHVFLLSYQQMQKYLEDQSERTFGLTDYIDIYDGALHKMAMLRTPGGNSTAIMTLYTVDGSYYTNVSAGGKYLVLPAITLDSDKILMISDKDGKDVTVGETLSEQSMPTSPFKLTFQIDSNFTVTDKTARKVSPGDKITLACTGGATGNQNYISCMLTKDGVIKYYGKLASLSSAVTSVTIDTAGIEEGEYVLSVFWENARDGMLSDFASAPETIPLTITSGAPVVSTELLPEGSEGAPYTAAINVTGDAPVTISVTGLENSGITFTDNGDGSGTISGNNPVKGDYTVTVTATNSNGSSPPVALPLKINEATSAPQFTTPEDLPGGRKGDPYETQIIAVGNPTPVLEIKNGSTLPKGLKMDDTGKITGTIESSTTTFTVVATNSLGSTEKVFRIEVDNTTPIFTTPDKIDDGVRGDAYSFQLEATGGSSLTYSYIPSSTSALPDGLSVSSTGQISGTIANTAALGEHKFIVEVSSSPSLSFRKEFSMNVHDVGTVLPEFLEDLLTPAYKGQPYDHTLLVQGDPAFSSQDLPDWLNLEPNTGRLHASAVPDVDTTYSFTITISNAIGSKSRNFTLTVGTPQSPSLTNSLPNGIVDVPYSETTATGIPEPQVTVTSGALPGGLNLVGAELTGLPDTEGSYTFTLKAENANGEDEKSYTIVINPTGEAPQINTHSLPDGEIGVAYSADISVSGTPAPDITYSGSLPDGLTLSGNRISGIPTAEGTFDFEIQASNLIDTAKQPLSITITDQGGGIVEPTEEPSVEYSPDPMEFDLQKGPKTGQIKISLGTSSTQADKAMVSANGNAVTVGPGLLANDGIVTVTANSKGNATVSIRFLDQAGSSMENGKYDRSIRVTVSDSGSGNNNGNNGNSGGNSGGSSGSRRSTGTPDVYSSSSYTAPIIDQEALWNAFLKRVPGESKIAKDQKLSYLTMVIQDAHELTTARSRKILEAADLDEAMYFRLKADTTLNGKIQVRISLQVDQVTASIKLRGWTADAYTESIRRIFGNYYSNKMRFIVLEQSGSFGQRVHVAARVDLSDMDTENLVLYVYDREENTFEVLENSSHYVGPNGYFHFNTAYGGDIIISEGELKK